MEQDHVQQSSRPGALSLSFRDSNALYAAYMPFIDGGGIFIPTSKSYRLGDEIFMLIGLPGDPGKLPVAGRVVWVTPAGAQGSKAQGVGVRFNHDEGGVAARGRIEALLAGQLNRSHPTHTM